MSASNVTALAAQGVGGTASFTTDVTITAGTRERVSVGTVGEGRTVISNALLVTAVQDPGGDLEVALFNGQEQVTPERETAVMTTDSISLPGTAVYDTGDEITVELDARNRSADIDLAVAVTVTFPDDVRTVRELTE